LNACYFVEKVKCQKLIYIFLNTISRNKKHSIRKILVICSPEGKILPFLTYVSSNIFRIDDDTTIIKFQYTFIE